MSRFSDEDKEKSHLLKVAIEKCDLEAVKSVLYGNVTSSTRRGATDWTRKILGMPLDGMGQTALHLACINWDKDFVKPEIIEALLFAGADIEAFNGQDGELDTPRTVRDEVRFWGNGGKALSILESWELGQATARAPSRRREAL